MFGFPYRLGRDLAKLPSRQLNNELLAVGFREQHDVIKEDEWVEVDPDYKELEEKQENEWWERFFNLANPVARQVGIRLSLTSTRTHYAVKEYLAVMKNMQKEEMPKKEASLEKGST